MARDGYLYRAAVGYIKYHYKAWFIRNLASGFTAKLAHDINAKFGSLQCGKVVAHRLRILCCTVSLASGRTVNYLYSTNGVLHSTCGL